MQKRRFCCASRTSLDFRKAISVQQVSQTLFQSNEQNGEVAKAAFCGLAPRRSLYDTCDSCDSAAGSAGVGTGSQQAPGIPELLVSQHLRAERRQTALKKWVIASKFWVNPTSG